MPADKYSNFKSLLSNEIENSDYRIVSLPKDSSDLIMAPHGGNIEPFTSKIAACIASEDKSLYLFEGLRSPLSHYELHVTSHKYDEPLALEMARSADRIVAIHGRRDDTDTETVWVGGLDINTADIISNELKKSGFHTSFPEGPLAGKRPENICNRSSRSQGVQLEIPRTLRNKLRHNVDALERFSSEIRAALA